MELIRAEQRCDLRPVTDFVHQDDPSVLEGTD